MTNIDPKPFGLYLGQDLFFGGKVTSTARELGLQVEVVGSVPAMLKRLENANCRLVLVDLSLPGLLVQQLMNGLPTENRPKVVAFGAHVHTALLDAAREAGCDEVMPRSKFSATLPALLRQYLGA